MNQNFPKINNDDGHEEGEEGVLTEVRHQQFSGPLPHPDILERYDEIVPGAAERILRKFEMQTEHRQEIEKTVIKTDSFNSIVGLVFGFLISMTAIVGGLYAALHDKVFLGGSLSFAGLGLLVAAFLTSRNREKSQGGEKDGE